VALLDPKLAGCNIQVLRTGQVHDNTAARHLKGSQSNPKINDVSCADLRPRPTLATASVT